MNILIVGDRKWNDSAAIRNELKDFLPDQTVIFHKLDSGATLVGKVVAEQLGMKTQFINEHNDDLLLLSIDLVLIFHNYIRGSVQSKLIIDQCQKCKIPYRIITNKKEN